MNKEQTITGVIRGTGACVPERVLDNNEIAGFVDTSDKMDPGTDWCGATAHCGKGNDSFHGSGSRPPGT